MVAIRTLKDEDAKRPSRERLVGEQSRIVNRMKAALIRLGIRGFNPKLKRAAGRLDSLRTPEGEPIPPNTLACYARPAPPHGGRTGCARGIRIYRIAHLLRIRCSFCGAPAGELCRTKAGREILSIGMMHDARITPTRVHKRYRRFS